MKLITNSYENECIKVYQAIMETNANIFCLSKALSFKENQGRQVMIRYRTFDQK